MARQNQLFFCAGMRSAIMANCCTRSPRDPAMVVYLDNVSNKKSSPNENFAREVMELFTLVKGITANRTSSEAAVAFTGWSLDRKTGDTASTACCTIPERRPCSAARQVQM